jgi:hypothetical protein
LAGYPVWSGRRCRFCADEMSFALSGAWRRREIVVETKVFQNRQRKKKKLFRLTGNNSENVWEGKRALQRSSLFAVLCRQFLRWTGTMRTAPAFLYVDTFM